MDILLKVRDGSSAYDYNAWSVHRQTDSDGGVSYVADIREICSGDQDEFISALRDMIVKEVSRQEALGDLPEEGKKEICLFSKLCLGARFSYPDDDRVWIKLSSGGSIALFDPDNITTNWIGQPVFCFSNDVDDGEVVVVG